MIGLDWISTLLSPQAFGAEGWYGHLRPLRQAMEKVRCVLAWLGLLKLVLVDSHNKSEILYLWIQATRFLCCVTAIYMSLLLIYSPGEQAF